MKFLGRENKIDCLISEGMWKIEKYMRGREKYRKMEKRSELFPLMQCK